ncbi:hypothetical protein [Actinokineospora bangkokensis]|uniref:Methyl-accepting chemotaxis protein n=1 Tax=Actinokineospora bangkokensis TaxID=1193682 RepID=A0A1Q9LJE4_9PSEU|nr:hypothetical protein [Actinokineospora bangkokensis]OLR92130.1 hypothetical protein BJP25_22575 [Actinokineospora bangkokensis]
MAGVEEIRAAILQATEKAQSSIAAITQASLQLDEARSALLNATQGSTQVEVSQSQGLLAEALQTLQGVQTTIQSGIASAEGYAARL